MPRRVYLCPVIGSGTDADPQRAAIADHPDVKAHSAVISVYPLTGKKRLGWTVCRVEAVRFTSIDTDGRFERVPTTALDTAVPAAVRSRLQAAVPDVALTAGLTGREMLRKLVQAHYPLVDESAVL